ncbi:MAG: hypothetical protein ACKO7R_04050 [Pseudanabaena sp.]
MTVAPVLKTTIDSRNNHNLEKIIPVITQALIGEICQQVSFSYGDELKLHFGEMTPCKHPKLAHLLRGSWRFGARATPWTVKHQGQILVVTSEADTDEQIAIAKEIVKQLEHKKLIDLTVEAETIRLTLSFEDGYQLILDPDLEDDSGLAHWELFMPTEQVLAIGPGYFWSCKSIHEP